MRGDKIGSGWEDERGSRLSLLDLGRAGLYPCHAHCNHSLPKILDGLDCLGVGRYKHLPHV